MTSASLLLTAAIRTAEEYKKIGDLNFCLFFFSFSVLLFKRELKVKKVKTWKCETGKSCFLEPFPLHWKVGPKNEIREKRMDGEMRNEGRDERWR